MKHTLETLLELAKTDEGRIQIRVMVAELIDLPKTDECPDCHGDGWCGSEMDHEPCYRCNRTGKVETRFVNLPNYTTSLDAMAEAEETLQTPKEKWKFAQHLHMANDKCYLCHPGDDELDWDELFTFAHSTALQRAIAFILTKQSSSPCQSAPSG